jgi:hypothetical protein
MRVAFVVCVVSPDGSCRPLAEPCDPDQAVAMRDRLRSIAERSGSGREYDALPVAID